MKPISARRLALLVAANTALAPFAIDAYLPAMPMLAEHVGASVHHTSISISIFLFGFAFGQLLFGPLSDRLGRRPVLIGGVLTFIVSSLALTMIDSLHALWFWRFIQALGGGACVVNSPAIVRDCFSGREAAKVLSTMVMILLLAPLLAPALGSVMLYIGGWQLIFAFLAVYGLGVLGSVLWLLPETSVRPERPASARQVLGHYRQIVTHRAAMGYIFAVALSFAGMFAFITSSPYVYLDYYGVSPAAYPLLFGINILVMAGSNRVNIRLLSRHSPRRLLKIGLGIQLCAGIALAVTVALGLDSVPVIAVLVMCFVGMSGLINPNAVSSMLDYFPQMSATANAVLGCVQFTAGALSGGLISAIGISGVWPMVLMMLLSTLGANLLLRWLSERRMLARAALGASSKDS
ncbi:Bcr/CflA family multidrug efflux MFS transporter [Halotalea alkalilenta]|uniref:Bcr/CflA family multidrug efflux MFS transporter n=1 Tax=Halotalea alkalilenta TaxID=376489 RepID=UPI000ACE03EC|nr:Bcr/CflA family multidrug efflux MFS transporter [Halotalea alkalilenta]